jgi:hypothetical protein
MRKTIVVLGLISAGVHLAAMVYAKNGQTDHTATFFLRVGFLFWGMLPFIALATLGKFMPKATLTLGILCLIALSSLFWDVYLSATSSTAAIGLVTGPVILTIIVLSLLGLFAIAKSFRRGGRNGSN